MCVRRDTVLTGPQATALQVLGVHGHRDWTRASKRASTCVPRPNVNLRAADSLVKLGLAQGQDLAFLSEAIRSLPSSRFVCTMQYRITDAGLAELTRG